MPYVFTEQGVAMLASILRTNVASSVRVDDEGNYYHKMSNIAPSAICDFDYLKYKIII